MSQYVILDRAVCFSCDALCKYTPVMFLVVRPNVLGSKLSEDVFILRKIPNIFFGKLVLSLFGRTEVEDEDVTGCLDNYCNGRLC